MTSSRASSGLLDRRGWWIGAFLVALLIRLLLAGPLAHDWDGYVFAESAEDLLEGRTPYARVEANEPDIYPDSDRPMTQQWYAYPALPLLMFTATYGLGEALGLPMTIPIRNVALKLPFILGDLLCAWLLWRVLRTMVGERSARRAAALVLFNPLLIWVSGAWGMFDLWMVNFLLLFVLALRSRRAWMAGAALALAPQVKLFPLLFLPVALAFGAAWLRERRERARFAVGFLTTTSVLVLPFLLESPRGFVNQNLVMHLSRPPQGVGLTGLVDFVSHTYGMALPSVGTALGVLGLSVVVLFNLWGVRFVGGDVRRFVAVITLVYATALVASKVVNEQYFVVLVVLLIFLGHTVRGGVSVLGRRFLGRLEWVTTCGVFVATLFLGFHFLTFFPARLVEGGVGQGPHELVASLRTFVPGLPAHTFPGSVWTFYNLPTVVAYVAMGPVLLGLIALVGVGAWGALRDLRSASRAGIPLRRLPSRRRLATVGAVAGLVVAVAVPSHAFLRSRDVFEPVDLSAPLPSGAGGPSVGTFYYAWWHDAARSPDFRGGAWEFTSQTPEVGPYTSKNSYFDRHMRQMRGAGIDFAVVSYHLYDRDRFHNFASHADRQGFGYAPLVESDAMLDDPDLRPRSPAGETEIGYRVSAKTRERLSSLISSTFPSEGPGEGWLRIDGKPVVFVYDGHFYFPSWDATSRELLARRVLERYGGTTKAALERLSQAWGEELASVEAVEARHPGDIHEFNNANPSTARRSNDDYREAFIDLYAEHWRGVRRMVEEEVGPVYLVSTYPVPVPDENNVVVTAEDLEQIDVFDNTFAYSLSNTWTWWRTVDEAPAVKQVWEEQTRGAAQRDERQGRLSFQTVTPAYDDRPLRGPLGFTIPAESGATYDWSWEVAATNDPDVVLIATWNEFFEGTAIEPTREHGDDFLRATKRWTARLNR